MNINTLPDSEGYWRFEFQDFSNEKSVTYVTKSNPFDGKKDTIWMYNSSSGAFLQEVG